MPPKVDPVAAIQALGGADVAVVLAASSKVFEQAFASLRRGGRLICVALPAEGEMSIPIFETVLKGISIIGSMWVPARISPRSSPCTPRGSTRVIGEGRRIDDVNRSIEQVLSGKIPARLVFEFEPQFAGHPELAHQS